MAASININNSSGKFIWPMAANVPEANIRESPGKNGRNTSPVSQKTIKNNMAYTNGP